MNRHLPPPIQPQRITLRIPPHRRVVLALIVVEQPTSVRRLPARGAQRQLEANTVPVRIDVRHLVTKHLALAAPLPDSHVTDGIDHHPRGTQVVRLHVGHFRYASTRSIDQRNRIVVQSDGLLQRSKRAILAEATPLKLLGETTRGSHSPNPTTMHCCFSTSCRRQPRRLPIHLTATYSSSTFQCHSCASPDAIIETSRAARYSAILLARHM